MEGNSAGFNIRGFRGSTPNPRTFNPRFILKIIRGVVSTHGPDQLLYLGDVSV